MGKDEMPQILEEYRIIGADAFAEDPELDDGLPLKERRQALVAYRRLLRGERVEDVVGRCPSLNVSVRMDEETAIAHAKVLFRVFGVPQVSFGHGAGLEEALARALSVALGELTTIISERRLLRAIELGKLAGAVAAARGRDKGEG